MRHWARLLDGMARLHARSLPGPTGPADRGERAATALVGATMLVAVVLRTGRAQVPDATLITFSVLAWLPLLVRTRWPRGVLSAVIVIEALHLALVPWLDPGLRSPEPVAAYQPVPLATMLAVYTVATRASRAATWAAGIIAAGTLFVTSVLARPLDLINTDLVMVQLVVLATAAGALVAARRERVAHQARERESDLAGAVTEERLRIARELHDVLAHNLTLVNAQAGVADYLMRTDPAAAATALADITQHTARALDELRATVGLLRGGGESASEDEADLLRPMPDLERLDDLVAEFRGTGMTVELTSTGPPRPLDAATGLTAYRIVQEALTNAAKHAPGATARVDLRWSPDALDLTVRNDAVPGRGAGPAPGPARSPGTGHGLIGMRERARSVGGGLTVGNREDGGFEVAARIPARG